MNVRPLLLRSNNNRVAVVPAEFDTLGPQIKSPEEQKLGWEYSQIMEAPTEILIFILCHFIFKYVSLYYVNASSMELPHLRFLLNFQQEGERTVAEVKRKTSRLTMNGSHTALPIAHNPSTKG
jgi:hypothetical protein